MSTPYVPSRLLHALWGKSWSLFCPDKRFPDTGDAMMDSRILEHPHAQFGGSLGGMVGMGFPYHLGHHHVYDISGHQLQSAAAVPFSIDGLLNGSCSASVANSNPLLGSGCGVNGDSQYKLSGKWMVIGFIHSMQNIAGHTVILSIVLG